MDTNYIFKKAEESEIPEINAFNDIGKSRWKIEFFSEEKPMSFLYECRCNDEVVGTEGYVDYYMNYKGEKVVTHRSERTLVSGNHRGKGIFDGVVKKCDENGRLYKSRMCWGSTTALKAFANVGFEKYTGFRIHQYFPVKHSLLSKVGKLLANYKLFNPVKGYKKYKTRDLVYLKQLLAMYSFLKGAKSLNSGITLTDFNVEEVNKRQAEGTKGEAVYSIYMDQTFLNWLDKKGRKYSFYQLAKEGKNVGHIIYYLNDESSLIHVVDFYINSDVSAVEAMSALSEKYKNSRYISIFLALNNENVFHKRWIEELKRSGVYGKDGLGSFVIKNLQEGDNSRIPIAELLLTDLWLEL